MRGLLVASSLCALMGVTAAQSPPRRPDSNLTQGVDHERGTLIQQAPRRRGIAIANGAVRAPRDAGEVWTNQLVHHAWAMEPTQGLGDFNVYYQRSTDGGHTYEAPRRLENQIGHAREVSVCATEHRVFVTWISNELGNKDQVYVAVSTDQGRAFTAPIMLNDAALAQRGDADEHWAESAGFLLYVAWEFDDRGRIAGVPDEDVRFAYLVVDDDGVVAQGADVRLNTPATLADISSPVVVADPDSSDVAVLWFDARDGPSLALYGVWSRAFGIDFPLVQDRRVAGPPAAAAGAKQNVVGVLRDPYLHVVWEDRRLQSNGGEDEPYYERIDLRDGTKLHGDGARLADWPVAGSADADQPWITADVQDPARIAVVWHDNRDRGGTGNDSVNDTFCTTSADAGATWSPNRRLSSGSGLGTGQRNECWGVAWDGAHLAVSVLRSELNTIGGPGAGKEDALLFASSDAGTTWREVFVTEVASSFGQANDIDNPYMAMTRGRHDVVTSFYDDSYPNFQGHGDLLTSGVRLPWVRTTAPATGGATIGLTVELIDQARIGDGGVLLLYNAVASGQQPGLLPFGRGLSFDLVPDAFTTAFAGVLPVSVLTVQPGGHADTASFALPAVWPGPLVQVQALVFDGGLAVREASDPLQF